MGFKDSFRRTFTPSKSVKAAFNRTFKGYGAFLSKSFSAMSKGGSAPGTNSNNSNLFSKIAGAQAGKVGKIASRISLRRAFHAAARAVSALDHLGPDYTSGQFTPIFDVFSSIAQIMPGPIGTGFAGAAQVARIMQSMAANTEQSAKAQATFNTFAPTLGNDTMLAQITRDEEVRRQDDFNGGMTHWQRAKSWLGFRGQVNEDFTAAVQAQIRGTLESRSNSEIYSDVQDAVAKFSAKTGTPANKIDEISMNKILDEANNEYFAKLVHSNKFQDVIQKRLDAESELLRGGIEEDVERTRQTRELLADIKSGKDTPDAQFLSEQYRIKVATEGIGNFIARHREDYNILAEENKIADMRSRAEQHRHLAEF